MAGAPPVEVDLRIAWLAFDADPGGDRGIYFASAAAQCFDRVTPPGVIAKQPAFASDGERIAYAAKKDDTFQIFTLELASGREEQITNLPQGATHPTFSPTGASLAFVTGDPEAVRDGLMSDSAGLGDLMEVDFKRLEPRLVAARVSNEPFPFFAPAFSGSDRLFASNSYAIYAFYRDSGGVWSTGRRVTSPGVPQEAAPSPDGQWLAYPDTCTDTLTLYKLRIDLGSPRSCAGSRAFTRDAGVIAPDWGPFGMIIAETMPAGHGLRMYDEELRDVGYVAAPEHARNPSWSPADFKRACRP